MARSRSRNSGGGRRTTARSRKDNAAEVEVIEEEQGMGIDDGIMIVTFILLVAACMLVDYANGTQYGTGTFF